MPKSSSEKDSEREPLLCPFRIIRDKNEGAPWFFDTLRSKSKPGKPIVLCRDIEKKCEECNGHGCIPACCDGCDECGGFEDSNVCGKCYGDGAIRVQCGVPVYIEIEDVALWAKGRADYEIAGHPRLVQIEAKHSIDDLFQSFGNRRKNFEAEIDRLNRHAKFSAVIVCASWKAIDKYQGFSEMTPASIRASVNSWRNRYPKVHWVFIPDRGECERVAFELMEQAWRKRNDG